MGAGIRPCRCEDQAVLFVAVERDPKRGGVPYRFLCGNCNRYGATMPGDLCPACLAPARKAG